MDYQEPRLSHVYWDFHSYQTTKSRKNVKIVVDRLTKHCLNKHLHTMVVMENVIFITRCKHIASAQQEPRSDMHTVKFQVTRSAFLKADALTKSYTTNGKLLEEKVNGIN